ncbi:MAG: hypothetical protein C0617_06790 [Desulfuromonas sp.]|uniref:OmpP1/FadL family transporter n=1 Tax=Desulfuromonas sp. TaxID=892 RepID=UPI000CA7292B|nr:outer membrane protein transport protein [Desulfuromonas sp.]PLX84727.1 MAG: hypothetical protein C0617_06790 [Desulfuromonas sp.]
MTRRSVRQRWLPLLAFLLLVSIPQGAEGTNGMNLIGFGAVSPAMGGADLALVDNATAMNINPAGLCECAGPEIGLALSLLMPQITHGHSHGESHDAQDQVFLLPLLTYAQPVTLAGVPLTVGVGLFSQGGMGVDHRGLHTPFGTVDDLSSDVRYAKVTPTLAWRSPVSGLKLGASLNLGYANTEMELFPESSGPEFAGMDLEGMEAFGYGFRLGFQYTLGRVTFGGAYLSRSELDFDGGNMVLNFGEEKVRYDAEMEGFDWPRQAGLGISYHVSPRIRLAADVDWIDWEGAIDTIIIRLDNPSSPTAPASRTIRFPMDWKEQWVYAVGAEIEALPGWLLRLGYNHGDSPVPDTTLSPLFPAIVEDHLTAGVGTQHGQWSFDLAFEVALSARQDNDNPSNPFGGIFYEKHSQFLAHAMVRRFF